MDDYTLGINLKNKSAIMILPYFVLTYTDKSKVCEMVQGLSECSDKLIVSVEDNKIHVKIKYDFGPLFSEEIWKTRDSLNNSLISFVGYDADGYLDHEFKKVIFEKIKEKYFVSVVNSLQKSATEFQKQYFS